MSLQLRNCRRAPFIVSVPILQRTEHRSRLPSNRVTVGTNFFSLWISFVLANISSHRYYQPNPNAPSSPYPLSATLNDPDFSKCLPGNCDALGLRIYNSQGINIYGAGLYSFFNHYSTTCSNQGGPENCQSEIFSIEGSTSSLRVYTLITIGTPSMVTINGVSDASYSNNVNTFPDTIAYFSL
jgi:hypothetical protein